MLEVYTVPKEYEKSYTDHYLLGSFITIVEKRYIPNDGNGNSGFIYGVSINGPKADYYYVREEERMLNGSWFVSDNSSIENKQYFYVHGKERFFESLETTL